MKYTETIHVKVDQTKRPNKLHLEIQQRNKAAVFKPKKGKGSFRRKKKVEVDE